MAFTPVLSSSIQSPFDSSSQHLKRGDLSNAVEQLWFGTSIPQSLKLSIQTDLIDSFKKIILEESQKYSADLKASCTTAEKALLIPSICNKIFSFVDDRTTKQRIQFAGVCKQFEFIAYAQTHTAPPSKDAILATFDQLARIKNDCEYTKIRTLATRPQSQSDALTDEKFEKLAHIHSKICFFVNVVSFSEHDRLTDKSILTLGKYFPHLQRLNLPAINGSEGVTPNTVELLSKNYHFNFYNLNVNDIYLNEEAFKHLQQLKKLNTLSLNCRCLNYSGKLSIHNLTLKDDPLTKNNPFIRFIQLNPQLQSLTIINNPYIHKKSLRKIIKAVPDLTSLSLIGCSQLHANAVHLLSRLPRLKAINLTDCHLDDDFVKLLSKACPQLESVILASSQPIKNPQWIGDKGILALAKNCKNLAHIDVRNSHLTSKGLEFLTTNFPNILIENLPSGRLTKEKQEKMYPEFQVILSSTFEGPKKLWTYYNHFS